MRSYSRRMEIRFYLLLLVPRLWESDARQLVQVDVAASGERARWLLSWQISKFLRQLLRLHFLSLTRHSSDFIATI